MFYLANFVFSVFSFFPMSNLVTWFRDQFYLAIHLFQNGNDICTKSAFPTADKVIETNYCHTKVALTWVALLVQYNYKT